MTKFRYSNGMIFDEQHNVLQIRGMTYFVKKAEVGNHTFEFKEA